MPRQKDGYSGYHLENGQVVEQYDHTDEDLTEPVNSGVPLLNQQQTRFNPNLIQNIENIPQETYRSNHAPGLLQPAPVQSIVPTSIPNQTLIDSSQMTPGNISQQPIIVLDEHKKSDNSGCCGPCTSCCKSCNRVPCCSIFSFFLILIGTAMVCVCGWLSMEYSFNLWEDYGPPKGNPVFDPAPIWIKNVHNNVGFDWKQVNPNYRPGNYLPWVREGLEYFLIVLGPLMFIVALIMLTTSCIAAKEIHERSTYTQWSSVSESNVCCTMFIMIFGYVLILFYLIWSCFAALAVYYYRIVYERCYNLNSQGFEPGIRKNICLDLVQLGVVRFIPVNNEGYGKLCGPGNNVNDIKVYGDLEGYCENYTTTYILTIVCFAGGPIVIIGLINYMMILSTNYTIMTGRYIKKFVKMDAKTINIPMKNVNTNIPIPAARSNVGTLQSSILPPYNGAMYSQTNLSKAPTTTTQKLKKRRTDELDNYYKD